MDSEKNQQHINHLTFTDAVSLAGNDSHYQSLIPEKRSQQRGGSGRESSSQIVGGPVSGFWVEWCKIPIAVGETIIGIEILCLWLRYFYIKIIFRL